MKIGRNDKCLCGSGKKYKRCCANKSEQALKSMSTPKKGRVTLTAAIEDVQSLALQKRETMKELGVFLFYSDIEGDAWLLEVTESDCIQIASKGEKVNFPLEENAETIVVDWTHTFAFEDRKLKITSYRDKISTELSTAPVQQLFAAEKRILRKFSPEQLEQIHISK